MTLTAQYISEATGGSTAGGGPGAKEVTGVSTDTRTIKEGEAFFALKGPSFDGADFLGDAAAKGAAVAVVSKASKAGGALPIIEVEDTLSALGDLARRVRLDSDAKVLAVTGTTGKTTTKEMAAAILAVRKRVLKSEGNRNNQVGLPTALMGLTGDYGAAVVEIGINTTGEMERLSYIASPDVALITSIGVGHTEGLGDIDGVTTEKLKLFASLGAGGTAVINMDDPRLAKAAEELPDGIKVVTFGRGGGRGGGSGKLDVKLLEAVLDKDEAMVDALYDARGEEVSAAFTSPLVANAENGAAAIAGALAMGATIDDIRGAMASVSVPAGRMEVVRCTSWVVIDDSYNANPESMRAALATLADFDGPRVAVLGDMLELGDLAWQAHRSAGKQAALAGVRKLVAIGEHAGEVAQGATASGMKHVDVLAFSGAGKAVEAVAELVEDGDTVLVKGSRAVGLDKVVDKLKERG